MHYQVIIIGGGPAGYTAGIYSVRAGLTTLILEGEEYGGQLMTTTDVENYPGFAKGIMGPCLMENLRNQCINLGCTVKSVNANCVRLSDNKEHPHYVDGYEANCVIIATGATAKRLNLPDEDIYWNKGISACAVCDGAAPIFRNKPIAVVGGGDTACEEAMFLSRFASVVYILVRSNKMRASHHMKNKVENNDKIVVMYNIEVVGLYGDDTLEGIRIRNNQQDKEEDMIVSGLFYGIGHKPNTDFLTQTKFATKIEADEVCVDFLNSAFPPLPGQGELQLDDEGYIVTDNTKTLIPGVYACGDVQDRIYKQAITAAASGCIAALEAERYLSS